MSEKTILPTAKIPPLSPITVYALLTIIIIGSTAIIYSQLKDSNSSQDGSRSFVDMKKKFSALEEQVINNKNLIRSLRKELAALRKQNKSANNLDSNATSNPVSICMRGNDSINSRSDSFEIRMITSKVGTNIRINPGLDQKIIGNLSKDTSVCIKKADDTVKTDNYIWVKIYAPHEGWVAQRYLGN